MTEPKRPQVKLKVFRFDPAQDTDPHYDTFVIATREKMTVLDALFEVLEHQDGSLSFRYSCRGSVCGSCAMFINGFHRLACETLVASLGPEVRVAPLPYLPVVKDLAVDMTAFFAKYERIRPFLMEKGPSPIRENLQGQEQRRALDEVTDCILCASCYSACPVVWLHQDFLGPAALTKAFRFVADSRDGGRGERLALVSGPDGVWRCHTIFNCAQACPKKINCTRAIQHLKRKATARRLGWRW